MSHALLRARSGMTAARKILRRPLCAAVFLLIPLLHSEPSIDTEQRVKATFLFNFAQFVDWPDSALPARGAPFVIGILGKDPFNTFLDELVRGQTIKERKLEIRRLKRMEEINECQVVFVSDSEQARFDRVIARCGTNSILTVGEGDQFARRGGMIAFVPAGNKVRFRINREAAESASLSISSKLLRLSANPPASSYR